jgi:hypothetical protein
MKIYKVEEGLVSEEVLYENYKDSPYIEAPSVEYVHLVEGVLTVRTEEEQQAYLKSLEPTIDDKANALLAEIGDKEAQKQALRDKLAELEGAE